MTDKLRLDATDLTLGELADLETELGGSLDTIMEASQGRGIAGIAWIIKRRTVPDYTMTDALALKMSDLELTDAGETQGGNNGASPQLSPAPGP